MRIKWIPRSLLGAMLECADNRGPDRHDAPAICSSSIQSVGCRCVERVPLAMEFHLVDALYAKRSERSETNVKRDPDDFNATSGELFQDLRRKMQPGSRRSEERRVG